MNGQMRAALMLLALLLPLLPRPGVAEGLKVATWNLNWLTLRHAGDPALPADVQTRDSADFTRLRGYASALGADVVAIEEVDGPPAASQLFPAPAWQLHMTGDHVVQRVGFAVRAGLKMEENPDLVALDPNPGAPLPLRSGADITLDLPGGKLRLLAVHLKTGCHFDPLESRRPACATLRRQIPALQGWIAQRAREGVPFIVLGDFNREMDGREVAGRKTGEAEELLAALRQAAPLARATEGHSDPCWGENGDFIDHILAGGAARAWMQPDTLRVLVYRETDKALKERLSDHCPVSVRFNLPG